jgi:hypothetical protein
LAGHGGFAQKLIFQRVQGETQDLWNTEEREEAEEKKEEPWNHFTTHSLRSVQAPVTKGTLRKTRVFEIRNTAEWLVFVMVKIKGIGEFLGKAGHGSRGH